MHIYVSRNKKKSRILLLLLQKPFPHPRFFRCACNFHTSTNWQRKENVLFSEGEVIGKVTNTWKMMSYCAVAKQQLSNQSEAKRTVNIWNDMKILLRNFIDRFWRIEWRCWCFIRKFYDTFLWLLLICWLSIQ